MKVRITQPGVFRINGGASQEVKVGTTLTLKTDALPAYLVGKVYVLPTRGVRVTNPKKEPKK